MSIAEARYVSRAGEKLAFALDAFALDAAGLVCADFGCNVGGFCECLLRHGASKVYAVDTGYGTLAWKLRRDPRVVVMERTNALMAEPPEPVDLVVIDVAWTPQSLILPAARRWLKPGGQAVSLLKPHYEAAAAESAGKGGGEDRRPSGRPSKHVLSLPAARAQCLTTCQALAPLGWQVRAVVPSPLLGGDGGNTEFLIWVKPWE